MRRSKVVCTLMGGCFAAMERARNSDDGPCNFVADGSLEADALRKRRPIRLNRLFGPFTKTFLGRVGRRRLTPYLTILSLRAKALVLIGGSINLNGCPAQSLAR